MISSRDMCLSHGDGYLILINRVMASAFDLIGDITAMAEILESSQRENAENGTSPHVNHDGLTGLADRTLLHELAERALIQAKRDDGMLAVMCVDLDRFRDISDGIGHDAANDILVEVSRRLSKVLRNVDIVARLSRDEFVVVITELSNAEQAELAANNIRRSLCQSITIRGQEFVPTACIGISMYPDDGANLDDLLNRAEMAMSCAKRNGRNKYNFYVKNMTVDRSKRILMESELRHALEKEELEVHYQIQIDAKSGRAVGAEALLRWHKPDKEIVLPADFIPLAEETGLIVPIGEWVLRAACTQQTLWEKAGHSNFWMAVNLSACQFKQHDLSEMIARVIEDTGCKPACLELEITESVLMDDPDGATETLRKLGNMGISLSIDDFGIGYSSLGYLRRFPIHSLKIDKSFIHDITINEDDAKIVTAIIALAHSMKLNVVAEGVETQEQSQFLRGQQCDQMQGFYFGRPAPAADVLTTLLKLNSMGGSRMYP
jgi:diguanylate cyclase (GGDEF)-like protein